MLCSTFVVYRKNLMKNITATACLTFRRIVLRKVVGNDDSVMPMHLRLKHLIQWKDSWNWKVMWLPAQLFTSCTSHTLAVSLRNQCSTPTFRDKQLITGPAKKRPVYRQQKETPQEILVKQRITMTKNSRSFRTQSKKGWVSIVSMASRLLPVQSWRVNLALRVGGWTDGEDCIGRMKPFCNKSNT